METSITYRPDLHVLLIGPSGSGKTSMLLKLKADEFDDDLDSGLTKFCKIPFIRDDETICVILFDIPQILSYNSFMIHFPCFQYFVLLFDKSSMVSFANMQSLLHMVKKWSKPQAVILIVGNKTDLKIEVSFDLAEDFARTVGVFYMESSIKNDKNLNFSLEILVSAAYKE